MARQSSASLKHHPQPQSTENTPSSQTTRNRNCQIPWFCKLRKQHLMLFGQGRGSGQGEGGGVGGQTQFLGNLLEVVVSSPAERFMHQYGMHQQSPPPFIHA